MLSIASFNANCAVMRFIRLWWALVLLCAVQSFGQLAAIDSLEALLKTSKPDTNRVRLLNELSYRYLSNQPPLALLRGESALALARSLPDGAGEMTALNRLSEYHWRQSNYARSVELATQSLKLAMRHQDSVAMASTYRLLGIINTYGFKQYDRALEYEQKALAYYERRKDYANIASLYGNITWIYGNTGRELGQAKIMAMKGLHLADSLHLPRLISYNYNSLALIALRENNLDSALYYLDQSIRHGQQANDNAVVAYNKSISGQVFLLKRDWVRAQHVLHESEREALSLDLREVLKDVYNGLAQLYGETQHYAEAFAYQRKFTALKDSLVNWEITQKALAMQFELDEQKREARIAELQQQAEQAKREKNIYAVLLSVGSISLAIIMALIVRNNRQRSKNNALLQEKNQEIAQQNLELSKANDIKDKLFSIIGHDLRSPLQSLKGMLGMVVQNQVSAHEFQTFAPQLHQHVIGVNETLENLLNWSKAQMDGWKQARVAVSAAVLINRVASLFKEAIEQKHITLITLMDTNHVLFADGNQVELIFRNLLHNAIKFTDAGGTITLQSNQSDGFIEVTFEDTGVGLTEQQMATIFTQTSINSTRGTAGERGTGLGLSLCREMARRNGGSISVTSKIGKGSVFTVQLPAGV
jgi:two-component system, sensor histidine kinase and response regulator